MNDGCLWCHFDDGTRLAIHSHESAMQYTDNSGGKPTRFSENDVIPPEVRDKLELLPSVVSALS